MSVTDLKIALILEQTPNIKVNAPDGGECIENLALRRKGSISI